MTLTKLQFEPGVNTETTAYSNEGGWNDCDKVRFRFGYPEKIGGWEKYASSTLEGTQDRFTRGERLTIASLWALALTRNFMWKKADLITT